MTRLYAATLVLAMGLAGCNEPETVASVTVIAPASTLEVGEELQLSVTARDAGGGVLEGRPVEWSSTDPAVASVSPTGLVTAIGNGPAEVRATVEGVVGSVELLVVPPPPPPPPPPPGPVATVTITAPAATVAVGAVLPLTAIARDSAGTVLAGRQFEWSSGDATKASVSQTGEVSGVAPGDVEIHAVSEGIGGNLLVTVTETAPPPTGAGLQEIASGLAFPVYLTSPPADERLFVLEKDGRIRVIKGGTLLETPFLDITALVSKAREQGLLGLAFTSDFATSGRFIVHYTDQEGDTRISSFHVSADPDVADPASEAPILEADQPFANHNGGQILFGPDGFLYIGLGDGGSSGDPGGRGQSLEDLLGSILRIDVSGGTSYTVPSDNPFVGTAGVRPEVWSYGLRNPWRFSFDRSTGDLYIADVGQGDWEEVNYAAVDGGAGRGVNYGWSIMEGMHCFAADLCDRNGLTLPVVEYGHDQGCSITGGYVYRGTEVPALQGQYLYADFCRGFVRSFPAGNPSLGMERPTLAPNGNISSFGEDASGELYIVVADGRVLKIVPQ
jgi:glucose/arabinose dehydrogenase